jgi:hypothetical protein
MPNASNPADLTASAHSWAEVRARGYVVRYRRSGIGRTVIVFGAPERADTAWAELLDVLGSGFRVIVPEPPPDEDDIPCWLSGFLEGLGIPSVRVLAAGQLCNPVLQLALIEGDQVAGVVLFAEVGDPPEASISELTVPVLVVDRSRPADEVIPLVMGFLRAG